MSPQKIRLFLADVDGTLVTEAKILTDRAVAAVRQLDEAGVILVGAAMGLPLSTSTVVTSAMVGSGVFGRRRHVRWAGVIEIFLVWVLTVPVCALVAAGLFEVLRRLS